MSAPPPDNLVAKPLLGRSVYATSGFGSLTRRDLMLTSLLDNDFYKITMQNAVIKRFPYAHARYAFINRGQHAFPE
uniref:hypothetical protein n=1 Tax=Streptomyces scabiei TaxID=1930 RepID=UPI0038F75556